MPSRCWMRPTARCRKIRCRANSAAADPAAGGSGRSGRHSAGQRYSDPAARRRRRSASDRPRFRQRHARDRPGFTLGVTFDDETTFSLSANTRIVVNAFVYQEGGNDNAASFNVAAGTAAFVASLVAKTGDMKITTPTATLGIRGTTGVVDVPAGGGTAASRRSSSIRTPTVMSGGSRCSIARRAARHADARRQRLYLRRSGRPLRGRAVQIPPRGSGARPGVLQRLRASTISARQMTSARERAAATAGRPNRPLGRTPQNAAIRGRQPRSSQANPDRRRGNPRRRARGSVESRRKKDDRMVARTRSASHCWRCLLAARSCAC